MSSHSEALFHLKIDSNKLSFLDLPEELRKAVYTEYFTTEMITIHLITANFPDGLSDGDDDASDEHGLVPRFLDQSEQDEGTNYEISTSCHEHFENSERRAILAKESPSEVPIALLRVAKSIYEEAKGLLYQLNTFHILTDPMDRSYYHDSVLVLPM